MDAEIEVNSDLLDWESTAIKSQRLSLVGQSSVRVSACFSCCLSEFCLSGSFNCIFLQSSSNINWRVTGLNCELGFSRVTSDDVFRAGMTFIAFKTEFPVKTLAVALFSYSCCSPRQWNFVPSDNRHIRSSHAFKFNTAVKAHLHKQFHNWFQILFLSLPPTPTPLPPSRPLPHNIYIYIAFLTWICKARCAHPCRWDTALPKLPPLLYNVSLFLLLPTHTLLIQRTGLSMLSVVNVLGWDPLLTQPVVLLCKMKPWNGERKLLSSCEWLTRRNVGGTEHRGDSLV